MKNQMKDYYKAPAQEVFDDIKANAIKIWQTYDNNYGYVDEKVNKIKDMKNIRDNWSYIVGMFDGSNQEKLLDMVQPEAAELIRKVRGY
jgi:hypothetical protein